MSTWVRMLTQVESYLSRALAVNVVRRHSRGGADSSDGFHYGPAVRIVTGNYVTGKRRGVVEGVDFGATGSGKDQTQCVHIEGTGIQRGGTCFQGTG